GVGEVEDAAGGEDLADPHRQQGGHTADGDPVDEGGHVHQKNMLRFLALRVDWSRITLRRAISQPTPRSTRRMRSWRAPTKNSTSCSRRDRYSRKLQCTSNSPTASVGTTRTLVNRCRVRDGGSSAQAMPVSSRVIRRLSES